MKLQSNWIDIRYLDQLACRSTVLHRLNPSIKLMVTLSFIFTVTSYPKYDISGLLPLFLYPAVQLSLGSFPSDLFIKRLLLVSPFVIGVGIFNPIFDQTPLMQVGSVIITAGWVSFLSITVKLTLTVLAALLLVATTGIDAICTALVRLRIPKIIVLQLLFMYRYIHVLLEEFIRSIQAYSLRSFHGEGLQFNAWGSLVGHLLIRTLERAQRIYQAMVCRGFDGEVRMLRDPSLTVYDLLYLTGWLVFFMTARYIDIPQLLGYWLTGGNR